MNSHIPLAYFRLLRCSTRENATAFISKADCTTHKFDYWLCNGSPIPPYVTILVIWYSPIP